MLASPYVLAMTLAALTVAGVGVLHLLRYGRRRAIWDTFAQWHGLTLRPDELVLEGALESHALRVLTAERDNDQVGPSVKARRRRLGNTLFLSSTYEVTLVRFEVSRLLSKRFSLGLEAFPGRSRHTEPTDEQVGDEEVDSTFELHGVTYKVEELLKDDEVREHMQLLAASALGVSVRNGWLQAEFEGVPATAEELEGLVLQVLETPRALQAAVQRFHLRRPRLA